MKSTVCEMFGIEFPLFAFTHCRDVVVAVSKAGGLGVLGAASISSPEQLEIELKWIDEHIDGMPYGVDLVVPAKFETQSGQETGKKIVSEPILRRLEKLAKGGHEGARELVSYFVGQGVGLMNKSVGSRWVVQDFMEEFADAHDRLQNLMSD